MTTERTALLRTVFKFVTYRQEKDEEFKTPRPLFFASTAFVDMLCYAQLDIFAFCEIHSQNGKFDITALAVGYDMIFAYFSRAKHISSM